MTERERLEEHDAWCDDADDLEARDAPETRRTPILRPLMMSAAEVWDFDLER